jgi:hypothetical protein
VARGNERSGTNEANGGDCGDHAVLCVERPLGLLNF